jgi:hypothetical protein
MLTVNMVMLARYWMSGTAAVHACCSAAKAGFGAAGTLKAGVVVLNSGRRRKLAVTALCLALIFSENIVRALNNRGLIVRRIPAQVPAAAVVAAGVHAQGAVVALDLHVGNTKNDLYMLILRNHSM